MEKAFGQKPAIHRPFLGIVLAFGAGILLDAYMDLALRVLAPLVLIFIILSWGAQHRRTLSTMFVLLSIVALGAIYTQSRQVLPPDHIDLSARYYRRSLVLIEGTIVSDVEKRNFFKGKKTVFHLTVKRLKTPWGWKGRSGKILVNLFRDEPLAYGDYIRLEGKLHRPFNFSDDGTFSYREFLNRKGIRLILSIKKQGYVEIKESNQGNPLKAVSLRVKHRFNHILAVHLSKNEASILQGFLVGDRYNIPPYIVDLFKISGVVHILAISGFNLGIIAFQILLFLKMLPMPRRLQYFCAMVLIIFYAFLTGGQPAVVRAAIMASVILAGLMIERESDSINTLSLAALLIFLMNPLNVFDVGFQLSFISVFSIIFFYPKCMNVFQRLVPNNKSKIIHYILQSLAVSLSASWGVAGLIAYYFHIVTPIGILANLIIVPLSGAVVTLGMGLLLTGSVVPSIAFAFAHCLKVVLNIMVAAIFLFVQIPGAFFRFKVFPVWAGIVYYGLLFSAAGIFKWSLYKRPVRSKVKI
jgi:competence protein ComEC